MKWFALKSKEWNRLQLVEMRGQKMHWEGSPSYCYFDPQTYDIVKEYETVLDIEDSDYCNEADDLILNFRKEFCPQPEEPFQSGGWINSQGKFFSCGYCGHESLSEYLSAHFYSVLGDSLILEQNRWVRIQDGGEFFLPIGQRITKAQIETIGKLISVSCGNFKQNIAKDLNNIINYD